MHKHEALLFTQLKAAFESGAANLQTLARVYTEKFPGGPHKSNVDDYIKKHWDDQMRKNRDRIRAITVDNPASLADKAKTILDYVNASYADDPAEITRMRRAADLALQFCQLRHYRVLLKHGGNLTRGTTRFNYSRGIGS